jgi:quercetin dioxygenase-like cupin family protein
MDIAKIYRPVSGVQVIGNIADQPGVNTIEGEIGPLIWGDISQTYFLDMPSGAYLDEHAHSFEALVYAVKGRYVLCSRGQRTVLEPGSLMAFAADVPTGYEVPFDESSMILVFRSGKPDKPQPEFVEGLPVGEPASLHDLAPDHPARVFGRTVNPAFT